jgi:uracil-DNA glycosylase family 4
MPLAPPVTRAVLPSSENGVLIPCNHINVNSYGKLADLGLKVAECRKCQRLTEYCAEVARVRRRAYKDQEYWGRPVPSFGDPRARLLILGLAPGAHGANRTGRVFTGDKSGDLLFRVLFRTGFANQPESTWRDDGLELRGAYISCSAHCAPPDNKPLPAELLNCRPWLQEELRLLTELRVVVVLGKIAFDTYLSVLKAEGKISSRANYPFGHNYLHALDVPVITSYHPSQQNTSTGRLTEEMLVKVFAGARRISDAAIR